MPKHELVKKPLKTNCCPAQVVPYEIMCVCNVIYVFNQQQQRKILKTETTDPSDEYRGKCEQKTFHRRFMTEYVS